MKAYYLFGKTPLPSELSSEINQAIQELSGFKDRDDYLRTAYEIIVKRFKSSRIKTALKFWDVFSTDIEDIWNRTNFLHCTNQNYLLALLLVKGGLFMEEDIKPKWTSIWFFSPHQYLRVKVGDKVVNIDAWGSNYGIPFGQYAHGFNSKLTRST